MSDTYDPNADQKVLVVIEETPVSAEIAERIKAFVLNPSTVVRGVFLSAPSEAAAIVKEELEAAEATLDDEEAAHGDTLRLLALRDEEIKLLKNLVKHAYGYSNLPNCGYEKMPEPWQQKFLELIGCPAEKLDDGLLKCGHPLASMGKVNEDDEGEDHHCLWCGDISDLGMLVDHLSTVYMHVSGGMVSKPETLPSVVIALGDDAETKRTEQAVADALAEIKGKIRGIADFIWQGLGERSDVTKLLYELAGVQPGTTPGA